LSTPENQIQKFRIQQDFRWKRERLEQLGLTVTAHYRHAEGPRYEIGIELPIPASKLVGCAEQ
jgi:nitrogenase molybdenum-iron protein alpha/beta subunit